MLPQDQQALVDPSLSLYDPSKSTTYQPVDGESYSLGYGDGSSSSGPAARENVNLGGATVPDMWIGVANQLKLGDGVTTPRNTDGPVGLAFQYGNSSTSCIILIAH